MKGKPQLMWRNSWSVVAGLGLAFCNINQVTIADENSQPVVQIKTARDGALIVPAQLLGKTRQLVVDTGSSNCVLDSRFKTALTVAGKTNVRTGAGMVMLTTYDQPELSIGDIRLSTQGQVIVIDMDPFREAAGREVDGVIGAFALQGHILRLVPDDQRLEIFTSLPDDGGDEIPVT